VLNEGDSLSIDGGAAALYLGRSNIVCDRPEAELAQVERWRRDGGAIAKAS